MTIDPSGNFGLFFWAAVAVVAVAVYVFRPSPPPAPRPPAPRYIPTYTPAPAPVSSAPATSSGGGYSYSGTSSWSGGGGSSGGGTVSCGGGGGGSYGSGGGSSGGGYVYVDPTIAMRSEYKTSLFGNFFSNVASSFTNRLKENTNRILSSIKTTADGILNTVTKPGQWFKNKYIDPVVDTVKDISDNGWKNSALGKTVSQKISSTKQAIRKIGDAVVTSARGLAKTASKTATSVATWANNNSDLLDKVSIGLSIAGMIPGVGVVADLASIGVDLLRGDFVGAGLSALSMIPGVGIFAGAAKAARLAGMAGDAVKLAGTAKAATNMFGIAALAGGVAKAADNVTDVAKVADVATDVAKAADTAKDVKKATGGVAPNILGKKGEEYVANLLGIKKNTTKIEIEGRNRIPDFVKRTEIIEVKNVAKLHYTKQLEDYVKIAEREKKQLIIYTRKTTDIKDSLKAAMKEHNIKHKYLSW